MAKQINARLQQKHDIEVNWNKATNFIPLVGEIIIYDPDETHKNTRFKIGDGITKILDLPFCVNAGTGNFSTILGEGKATGDFSVAGGTTDTSIIEDIAGISLNNSLVTDEKIVESLGERGLRLRDNLEDNPTPIADGEVGLVYGTGTHSITAMSVALGVGTEAGSMGFYLHKITVPDNGGNITIELSTKHSPYYKYTLLGNTIERNKNATWSDATAKQQLALWTSGDKINITLKKSYCLCESIISVNSNTGEVIVTNTGGLTKQNVEEATVFDSLTTAEGSMLALLPHHFTISVPSKPNVGTVNVGFGGIATGLGSIAAGTLSHAHGQMNLAADRYSFVVGRNNIGGLNAFASGQSTKATGRYSITAGLESEAKADQAVALGHGAVAEGESSVALNSRTTASGKYSTSMGRATEAHSRSQFVHGERNISDTNDKYLHIVGNSKTSGVYSNAYTLDWEGNGRFSGDVYAGVTYNNDGSVKSATKLATVDEIEQPNWSEGDSTKKSFITNKPSIKQGEGTNSIAEGAFTQANNSYSHAEGINTRANGYSSHSEGSQTNASGSAAHAEGISTLAYGNYSHAEGNTTMAYSDYSHAEGNGSAAIHYMQSSKTDKDNLSNFPKFETGRANGDCAHAEGNLCEAWGDFSHVEGSQNIAGARYSHAEGNNTRAMGRGTHAEGEETQALGRFSHAEGLGTIAFGDAQHTQGAYNIKDDYKRNKDGYLVNMAGTAITNGDTTRAVSNYIYILGNGYDDKHRSNAHTIDWEGNAWFAGSITMNGNKKLVTKTLRITYIDSETPEYIEMVVAE